VEDAIFNELSKFEKPKQIIFKPKFDETISGKVIRKYTFNLPNELPTAIKNNGLVFGNQVLRYLSLPPVFCIPSGECFE
jgi:hypothetical protein